MNNKNIIVSIIVLLILGAGVYFFINRNSSSTSSTPNYNSNETSTSTTSTSTPAPVVNQVIHNVSITGFAFSPASITVRKGETIVWTNKDSTPHTVTMTGGYGDLKSTALAQNQTYSFAFDKTGTFNYHCSLHPSMKGTVIVTD